MIKYKKALQIYKEKFPANHYKIAITLINMGTTFKNKYEFKNALQRFKEALELNKNDCSENHTVIRNLIKIGIIYCKKDELYKALDCYKEAFQIYKDESKLEKHDSIAEILIGMELIYLEKLNT